MPEPSQIPLEPLPPPPERPGRVRRWGRSLHTLVHALWSLLLLLGAALLWIWVFGLPAPITRQVLDRLSGDGFVVEVNRVHLDPRLGLTLDDFVLHGPPPLGRGFLRAREVGVNIDWKALLKGEDSWRGLSVRAGGLRWPYASPPAGSNHVWQTTGLDLDLSQAGHALEIVVHRGESAGIQLQASGRVARVVSPGGQPFNWSWLGVLASNSLAAPGWLEAVRAETAALRQTEPPRLQVSFDVDPAHLAATRVAWRATGARTFVRRGVVEGWRCAGTYDSGVLEVSDVSLRSDRGTARARARWRTAERLLDFDVVSDLPALHALSLLPPAARARMQAQGVEALEGLHLELRTADAPADSWARHLDGRLSASSLRWRTVPIRNLALTFAVRDEGMRMDGLQAEIGQGPGAGPVAGSWQSDWSGDYAGELDLRFDPHHALPFLSTTLSSLVSRFQFSNTPPHAVVKFTGNSATNGPFSFDGHLEATNFTYREVAVQSIFTGLSLTNSILELNRWLLKRPEGELKGKLVVEFLTDAQEVDMVSTIDGEALKQIIGPSFQRALDFTHFRGPAVGAARGRLEHSGPGTRLQVDIEAEKAGLLWFSADRVTLQLGLEGSTYRISNLVAQAYGGQITGTVMLVLATNVPSSYEINADAAGVRLESLIKALRPDDPGEQQGLTSASVNMRGLLGQGQGASVTGTGKVTVAHGQLSRLRLLGGLSSLLSAVAPGLGMASQTDFQSDFVIRNGRCETRDAMLEGSLLSIRVTGAYFFDQRMMFVVEVKPLRDGSVATVLRWVTSPITKLFSFRLSGTLSDPQWRPNNLPKEMFLIFD